ncbi:MAG TPA: COX15/CtaA family protein [Acidimicrobiales bacterium]|nr:COX15/CtaA family protein [Acidimicrobiales bacterium]
MAEPPARPPAARFTLSPRAFRGVALAAVVALTLTIVSGAAVRLTGSGLGCSTWPDCTRTSLVAPLQFHAWVEFGNRLINAVVTVASIGAFVAALRRRPRRRDLTLLSLGLVVGLLLEVVVGGLVVLSKLAPWLVSIHFLLGLAFLAVAVVLHQRAGVPDGHVVAEPMVGRVPMGLARLMTALLGVVVTLGTVVTSTGPHGGSPGTPRYGFSLHAVAQLHGTSVETFLVVTLVTLWTLAHTAAPAPVMRRAQILLGALVAQAAVGYTQYFDHDPVGLVALHVAGASLLVIAEVRFYMGLWDRRQPPSAVVEAAPGDAVAGAELSPA